LRDDLKEARVELPSSPGDARPAKQDDALQRMLKGLMTKVEQLKRKEQQA
jgi:hypothetical protein